MIEFDLSDKIKNTKEGWAYLGDLSVFDVKEFIKKLKEFIWDTMGDDMEKRERILMEIERLAGDKLR